MSQKSKLNRARREAKTRGRRKESGEVAVRRTDCPCIDFSRMDDGRGVTIVT